MRPKVTLEIDVAEVRHLSEGAIMSSITFPAGLRRGPLVVYGVSEEDETVDVVTVPLGLDFILKAEQSK